MIFKGVDIFFNVSTTFLLSDFHQDVNLFSWKVWKKLEQANPTEAGTGWLEKSTAEADGSAFLNDSDDVSTINGILDIALSE